MQFHTFSCKALARSARDFIKDHSGNKTKLIQIADGWLLIEFAREY